MAEALDDLDAERVREIVWMGGSTERGNRAPYAEFNAWADPEAAEAVLASGIPFTMIGLNLTHQALATPAVIARIGAVGTPLADWVCRRAHVLRLDLPRRCSASPAPPVHDPCAVALVAEPAVVRCVPAFLAIETAGRWTRGATVVDLDGRLGHAPNAQVAVSSTPTASGRSWSTRSRGWGAERAAARRAPCRRSRRRSSSARRPRCWCSRSSASACSRRTSA